MNLVVLGVVVLVLYIVAPYFYKPLQIRAKQKIAAYPRIEPLDHAELPSDVSQRMSRAEHDLYNMGFTITARYKMSDTTPNVCVMLTMLVNYQSGDRAMITAMWRRAEGNWKLGTLYTEFSTSFEDGLCYDTMNSATLSVHKTTNHKTQVPNFQDSAELWALHRFVMRKHNAQGTKQVYDATQAGAFLRHVYFQSFDKQRQSGRYTFDGQYFQPTIKGAYLMCWPLMSPFLLFTGSK